MSMTKAQYEEQIAALQQQLAELAPATEAEKLPAPVIANNAGKLVNEKARAAGAATARAIGTTLSCSGNFIVGLFGK
jgi:hypothetical protein